MKLNAIKNVQDLKAGRYIRCTVNYYGHHWTEVVDLTGKPFKVATEFSRSWKMKRNSIYQFDKEWYVSDLGVGNASPKELKPFFSSISVLVPFANKKFNYLSSIKDVREFTKTITGLCFTDDEWEDVLGQWSSNKELDEQLDAAIQEPMLDEYLQDESTF